MLKYIWFLIFVISCTSKKKSIYQDSSNKFLVTVEKADANTVGDSLYTFYDFDNPSEIKEAGFYKDGFRNDFWNYNLPNAVKTIKWGYYKDKNLNFETNLFSYADSIKYGDTFTKFLFSKENSDIILSINVNSPVKDSLPEINYERIAKKDLSTGGFALLHFNTRKLSNHIFVTDFAARKPTNEIKYVLGAFGFIDKGHFIELSVSSSTKDDFFARVLFNSVLTNFSIDGKRLYNPFHS